MLEKMKSQKTKGKKKNWFMDSYQTLKRKFTFKKEAEAEEVAAAEPEEEPEEEAEEFTVFDSRGDPVPEGDGSEDLPEWMKGREEVEDELENVICEPEYLVKDMYRGQTRGKSSIFSKTTLNTFMLTCELKTIFRIKPKTNQRQIVDEKESFKKFITPKK